jgi:hypothetical protein
MVWRCSFLPAVPLLKKYLNSAHEFSRVSFLSPLLSL